MTIQIAFVYLVLLASLALFITERLRVDLVALLVLGSLAVTGLVSAQEAFSGFSNPAVITVWAMFIISQGLSNTGIANRLGSKVLQLAGQGEARLVAVVTALAAVMSAFMNNIGVAALLLPVAMDICRTTGISPSRVLMPMAFGTLLGGLTTMIGTPPNLLVSAMLAQAGYETFSLFDFSLVGVPILIFGILFFQFAGRHLLPKRSPLIEKERSFAGDLQWRYGLSERSFLLGVPQGSMLVGQTIAESRLATSAGLKVIASVKDGQHTLLPSPDTVLEAGQQLLVQGRVERLDRLRFWSELIVSGESSVIDDLVSSEVLIFEVRVAELASIIDLAPDPKIFRERYQGNLLGMRRGDQFHLDDLPEVSLKAGDRLLVQGGKAALELLENSHNFDECYEVDESMLTVAYELPQQVFTIRIHADSSLVGETLEHSGFGDLFDFTLLGLFREGQLNVVPGLNSVVQAEDRLLIRGTEEQVDDLRSLQQFTILKSQSPDLGMLESEKMSMVEATLAPRSELADVTVGDAQIERKYGLELLAIWRNGRAYRSELNGMQLRSGDAFLLMGPREKLLQLQSDPDFLVLTPLSQPTEQTSKATAAAIILGGVVLSTLTGLLPISVASVVGAALMVLMKCLTMDEAYRSIEWRSIFLIAGMLPLGIALESTGGAAYLANSVLELMRDSGPMAIIFAFYIITALATLFVPTAALVVLMGPIVMTASADLGVQPQTAMMAVAIAASASFASPVSHPANLLIMGPGGYRFTDYLKLGLPLTVLVGVITAILLPWVWPLKPVVMP